MITIVFLSKKLHEERLTLIVIFTGLNPARSGLKIFA
jgi:hypothetical protein